MKVMIVVTHLLGSGHLRRAHVLARAFLDAGHEVLLTSGGMPVADLDLSGVQFLQLPPLRSDGVSFSTLLDTDGAEVTDALRAGRAERLIKAATEWQPDLLITELYPFGRRILRDEFQALLKTVHAWPQRPRILASVRDILAPPSKPARVQATEEIILTQYDAVLVHSDAKSTPLEASWPVSPALAARLRYTGYVAPPPAGAHPDNAGAGEVLVSAGGGAVGDAVFGAAIGAAQQDPGRVWRLLVAGGAARVAAFKARGKAPNLRIEATRPDFRHMLAHAACSVSLCGYNTALDLLQSGAPAVLIPFEDGGEVEQRLRAQSLEALPGFACLGGEALSPDALLRAIAKATATRREPGAGLGFDGAATSVEIAERLWGEGI